MFIALCIILIESLSFLLALHYLCCSTSMSLWLLHMPTNRLMSFLIGEEGFCLLLCCPGLDRSDRSLPEQHHATECAAALLPLPQSHALLVLGLLEMAFWDSYSLEASIACVSHHLGI